MSFSDDQINDIIGGIDTSARIPQNRRERNAHARAMGNVAGSTVGSLMTELDMTYDEKIQFLRNSFGFMFEGVTEEEMEKYPWIRDVVK